MRLTRLKVKRNPEIAWANLLDLRRAGVPLEEAKRRSGLTPPQFARRLARCQDAVTLLAQT